MSVSSSNKADAYVVVYLAAEVFVAVLGLLGNLLVVSVFVRDRRLRTPTNLYVFSLALTDLLTCAVATPLYVYSMLSQRPLELLACLCHNTLILTFCTVSIFHLMAVSFDRYMAVVWRRRPVSHAKGMRHAMICIGLAWASGVLVGCLPLMGWNEDGIGRGGCDFMSVMRLSYLMFLFYATIMAPTAVMVFVYGSILYTVKKHQTRMHAVYYSLDTRMTGDPKLTETAVNGVGVGGGDGTAAAAAAVPQHQRHGAKTKRIILTLILVVTCFLISWYPLYTLNAVTYYCVSCQLSKVWFYAPIVLSHLPSAINPLIYARTMPGYKKAFLNALACARYDDDERRTVRPSPADYGHVLLAKAQSPER